MKKIFAILLAAALLLTAAASVAEGEELFAYVPKYFLIFCVHDSHNSL